VVVADARAPRDGRFIEALGYYNPLADPPVIRIDAEKAAAWLRKGAVPSDTVRELLARVGVRAR
jgi:small subunit ribosomal protein S16